MIINFIDGKSGLEDYSEAWDCNIRGRVLAISYENLACATEVPLGRYVFSDLESLTPFQCQMAQAVADNLREKVGEGSVVNSPRQVLGRYELLHRLRQADQIKFTAYPARNAVQHCAYPVFIRDQYQHTGNLTELIYGREGLCQALIECAERGIQLEHALVVEFLNTIGPDGLFRKYSAFVVRGQVIRRHILFSHHWVQKYADLIDEDLLGEEKEYLLSNLHEDWIRQIFELAGVDYGRIDYGLYEGGPQVWEINTNPTILLPPERYKLIHFPNQELFASRFAPIVDTLDMDAGNERVQLNLPTSLRRAVIREFRRASWRRQLRQTIATLGDMPMLAPLKRAGKGIRKRYRVMRAEVNGSL